MGFYLRKAFGFGPLRLNLSRSGLGASLGIKGARVGLGPRGAYVHVGRGGLYYRQSLGGGGGTLGPPPSPIPTALPEIESTDASQMGGDASDSLLHELERVRRRLRWFPFALLLSAAVIAALIWTAPPWPASREALTAPPATPTAEILRERTDWPEGGWAWYDTIWWSAAGAAGVGIILFLVVARRRDIQWGTVALHYRFEPPADHAFTELMTAFEGLHACDGIWHIPARGATDDWKRNAGASGLVSRTRIRPASALPPHVTANVNPPCLPAGRQTLYFFPDRLLVYDRTGIAPVPYGELQTTTSEVHFREDEEVPADAQVVGTTWQYVNRRGGPDRRFRSNRELPIVLYGELRLETSAGLHEAFQCSRPEAFADMKRCLERIRAVDAEQRIRVPGSASEA